MSEPEPSRKPIDFEASLKKLREIVEQLEDGNISLEASLIAFEQGIALSLECETALSRAEQKVQILMESLERNTPEAVHDDNGSQ